LQRLRLAWSIVVIAPSAGAIRSHPSECLLPAVHRAILTPPAKMDERRDAVVTEQLPLARDWLRRVRGFSGLVA